MQDRHVQLVAIAPYMHRIVEDPGARVGYDLYADALVWSDEFPVISGDSDLSLSCLRPIIHYRTSLMLRNPKKKYQGHWETAQRLFPGWPGFSEHRREQSLRSVYEQLRLAAEQGFDSLNKFFLTDSRDGRNV